MALQKQAGNDELRLPATPAKLEATEERDEVLGIPVRLAQATRAHIRKKTMPTICLQGTSNFTASLRCLKAILISDTQRQ
jgi:hypothetical protein